MSENGDASQPGNQIDSFLHLSCSLPFVFHTVFHSYPENVNPLATQLFRKHIIEFNSRDYKDVIRGFIQMSYAAVISNRQNIISSIIVKSHAILR